MSNILTYNQSAENTKRRERLKGWGKAAQDDIFQQASLPIGNGDLGAAIYGEAKKERLIINEKSLWRGGPSESRPDYTGAAGGGVDENGNSFADYYYMIQNATKKGDLKGAEELFKKLEPFVVGRAGYGSYLCFGNMYFEFAHDVVQDYKRTLDIDEAIATVSYKLDGVEYKREYLASNPHNVIGCRFSASSPGALSFVTSFESMQEGAVIAANDNGTIEISGALQDNGQKYFGKIDIKIDGGKVAAEGGKLRVSDANFAEVYFCAATDYKMTYPAYRSGESADDLKAKVGVYVDKAKSKGYEVVKNEHIIDYKELYDRVKLDLGGVKPDMPTDKLLNKYRAAASRYTAFLIDKGHARYLEQLLFNYGRYLLISSSRQNSALPANLQGVWNCTNTPTWSSDYHLNVNLQMNYWHANTTALPECVEPLVKYIDGLRPSGYINAKNTLAKKDQDDKSYPPEYYGFIAHTESNPYGMTGMCGTALWFWSPGAIAWIMQNIFEKYDVERDIEYLKVIFPIIRDAAAFFERSLVEDVAGRLAMAPAFSPEHGPVTMGNAYENSLIWQLFKIAILSVGELGQDVAKSFGVDETRLKDWNYKMQRLSPIEIGEDGQIKEWYHEKKYGEHGEKRHRHISHLLGLYPGDIISRHCEGGQAFIDAARVTLDKRGDKSTGWAMGQRLNTWARIGDGDRAHKLIRQLFKTGIYANLWDAHPPFQIDGNFGYTAGVTEMLVQSTNVLKSQTSGGIKSFKKSTLDGLAYTVIELLPSLPSVWQNGSVKGLRVKGGFVLDMSWQNGKLVKARLLSRKGGNIKVVINGKAKDYSTAEGQSIDTLLH